MAKLTAVYEAMAIAVTVDFAARSQRGRRRAFTQLARLDAQLTELKAEVVGSFDGPRDRVGCDHPCTPPGVRETDKVPRITARHWVGLGRAMRSMSIVAAALADATITTTHARRLRAAASRPQFAEWGEAFLVKQASVLRWADWLGAVGLFEQCADGENQPSEPIDPEAVPGLLDSRREVRLFTGALRQAIIHADRLCAAPTTGAERETTRAEPRRHANRRPAPGRARGTTRRPSPSAKPRPRRSWISSSRQP